jgi:hypothetical protein
MENESIRALIDRKLKQPVSQKMIDDGYDLSVDLALDIFEYVGLTMKRDGTFKDLYTVIRGAQIYWEGACDYIESVDPTKTCQKFALLLVLSHTANTVRERIGDELADNLQSAIQAVVMERKSALFKDPVQLYPTMSDEEIDEIIKDCDPNLLKEFFDCFQHVKTFYANSDKYETEEEKEYQRKMLAIYNKLLK